MSSIKRHVAATVVDDTAVAMRLKYIGTGTVTSVTVDVSTDIVLISSDGSTETFLFSSYTTMGAMVDAINASNYWKIKILDALRTDKIDDCLVDGVVTISSTGVYDFLSDTSACKDTDDDNVYTYRVTYDRGFDKSGLLNGHRVRLQEFVYNVDVSAAQANGVRVYEWDSKKKTETQIYRTVSVDATSTTINWADGRGMIDAEFGNDLIVRVVDGTSITDADGNLLQVTYIKE